jgi:hypothetical protein
MPTNGAQRAKMPSGIPIRRQGLLGIQAFL